MLSLPQLPHAPGVYLMRDKAGNIIYIGKARDLRKRVANYFRQPVITFAGASARVQALVSTVRHVDYVATASEREALLLEQRLINRHMPTFNVMWKDDKSYPYVALTMGEDFPRLFLTRHKKSDGTLYFGPYPNVKNVRQLLRWAWRKKLFPLRVCKYEFDEKHLLTYEKVRSCLYLHTGECPAPCLGRISKKDYRKISSKAQWFFEGKQEKLIRDWNSEMKQLSKKTNYEGAAQVRDRINTLEQMSGRISVREMTEDMLKERIGGTRAVQDLMLALGLKKAPERVECFDISHIQGDEKVASMVSFLRGRPDKSQYRKFIIRTVKGIDDFKAMAEVVARRYRRLKAEGKLFPDLILIDGGKGQLSAAIQALKDVEVQGLAVAALAKEEEEIFLPHVRESVRLEVDSPALLLLRHIRDEAHRFAVTFHRQPRAKEFNCTR